jgi:hypothetical protein
MSLASSGSREGSAHLVSPPSTTTLGSGTEGINASLIQEFAALLYQDRALTSLISAAVSKERIGFEKMSNNFRKLLKHYAWDLKAEMSSDDHRAFVGFVSSYSSNITREFFSKPSMGDREVEVRIQVDELSERNYDSDQDSVAEGVGEEEPYDGSLNHLDRIECFILESVAYQTLRRRLQEFIYPSLRSKLRDLVKEWSRPGHKYHASAFC